MKTSIPLDKFAWIVESCTPRGRSAKSTLLCIKKIQIVHDRDYIYISISIFVPISTSDIDYISYIVTTISLYKVFSFDCWSFNGLQKMHEFCMQCVLSVKLFKINKNKHVKQVYAVVFCILFTFKVQYVKSVIFLLNVCCQILLES